MYKKSQVATRDNLIGHVADHIEKCDKALIPHQEECMSNLQTTLGA